MRRVDSCSPQSVRPHSGAILV